MDLNIGRMPRGPRNSIADVSGVRVGHCTVDDERHKTGVTVILPCEDDIFRSKMPAAYHVLNGFGKTAGLMQIGELGTLETPHRPDEHPECGTGSRRHGGIHVPPGGAPGISGLFREPRGVRVQRRIPE